MMESLRGATKNTMFDQWLGAIQTGEGAAGGEGDAEGRQAAKGDVAPLADLSDDEVQVRQRRPRRWK